MAYFVPYLDASGLHAPSYEERLQDLMAAYAYGDSMIGAGIDEGDMLVVRWQSWAKSGDLVIAFVEGEGNTLKRYFRDEKHKRFIIHGIIL